jgi:hypothetical protein
VSKDLTSQKWAVWVQQGLSGAEVARGKGSEGLFGHNPFSFAKFLLCVSLETGHFRGSWASDLKFHSSGSIGETNVPDRQEQRPSTSLGTQKASGSQQQEGK